MKKLDLSIAFLWLLSAFLSTNFSSTIAAPETSQPFHDSNFQEQHNPHPRLIEQPSSAPSLEQAESSFSQLAKLTSSDIQEGDAFGWAVAIDGDTLVVGVFAESGGSGDPTPSAGAAYVFERNLGGSDNWGQVAKLTASDAEEYDYFGYSVSISGDTIVLGAWFGDSDTNSDVGAAYIFERNLGGLNNWGEAKKLTSGQLCCEFGHSVAIDQDTIIVGAPGEWVPTKASAGAVYIFERNLGGSNNWGQATRLTASDAEEDDRFGYSVSLSGDTVVVGADCDYDLGPSNDSDPGAAYVFERDLGGAGNWGEAIKLTASDAQGLDLFGHTVSISGDTIAVGAPNENGGVGNPRWWAGAAYVFKRDPAESDKWSEVTKLMASNALAYDEFGKSISISGEFIIVGAKEAPQSTEASPPATGMIYVYNSGAGGTNNWGEIAILKADDAQKWDKFGWSVAVSGDTLLAGAVSEDGGPWDPTTASGAAYVFKRQNPVTAIYLPAIFK